MKSIQKFSQRVDALIALADKTFKTKTSGGTYSLPSVSSDLFNELRTSSLSLIHSLYGVIHPYYRDFENKVDRASPSVVMAAKGILAAIKTEIDNGWLDTLSGVVSAEIFSDFLEMAEHLLSENYKDPSAVMIGSVLEEHLRQLCTKNQISITELRNGKSINKKADTLNAELATTVVYNKLDQKSVTAWLDLRNKAAHGKYSEYNIDQVKLMLQGVMEFITRNSL